MSEFKQNAFICTKLELHSLTTYYTHAVEAGILQLKVNGLYLTVYIALYVNFKVSCEYYKRVLKYC